MVADSRQMACLRPPRHHHPPPPQITDSVDGVDVSQWQRLRRLATPQGLQTDPQNAAPIVPLAVPLDQPRLMHTRPQNGLVDHRKHHIVKLEEQFPFY